MIVYLFLGLLRTAAAGLLRQCDFEVQMRFRFSGAAQAGGTLPLGKDEKQKGRRSRGKA